MLRGVPAPGAPRAVHHQRSTGRCLRPRRRRKHPQLLLARLRRYADCPCARAAGMRGVGGCSGRTAGSDRSLLRVSRRTRRTPPRRPRLRARSPPQGSRRSPRRQKPSVMPQSRARTCPVPRMSTGSTAGTGGASARASLGQWDVQDPITMGTPVVCESVRKPRGFRPKAETVVSTTSTPPAS